MAYPFLTNFMGGLNSSLELDLDSLPAQPAGDAGRGANALNTVDAEAIAADLLKEIEGAAQ